MIKAERNDALGFYHANFSFKLTTVLLYLPKSSWDTP